MIARSLFATLLAALALSCSQADAASCNQQPIASVSTAHLEFQGTMIAVKVQGMASTINWTSPQLLRLAGSGDAHVLTYSFVACKPTTALQVATPIDAATVVMADTAGLSRIVVTSQTNSITLDVAQLRHNPVMTPPGNTAP